ncbi:MAG: hypothetical protein OJF51_004333 [Nitrospira sp.]|jgi:hypothetical protein|nr:MAG: hypothetical protein OJF51_004333 [Nitrospira sp.]
MDMRQLYTNYGSRNGIGPQDQRIFKKLGSGMPVQPSWMCTRQNINGDP